MLKEQYKNLFERIHNIYKENENKPVYDITLSKEEKSLLIKATNKHKNDRKKINENDLEWQDFIKGIIDNIKKSKDVVSFSDYAFIKIRAWVL